MFKINLYLLFFVYCFANIQCQNRIAGGSTVPIADYPFAAALLTNGGTDTAYQQACGGTILSSSAILSAASCFYTNGTLDIFKHQLNREDQVSWWRTRVGTTYANSDGTIYLINRITVHPDFNAQTLAHDIAVVRTTVKIVLQANVVEAARIVGVAYSLNVNQPVRAIGWGAVSAQIPSSDQLRVTEIYVVNQNTCTNRYNNIGFNVTEDMVCAGWLDVGIRGQCEGDKGSPLLNSNGAVVGVFSWAEGCANSWFPGINTRITPYVNWIISTATT